jgi:hypothetical protein
MLREHAFDSDSLFTQRLETDQAELLAEVVRDYWRSFMYPAGHADAARQVRGWWSSPEALQKVTSKACSITLICSGGQRRPDGRGNGRREHRRSSVCWRRSRRRGPSGWTIFKVLLDAARDKGEFNGTKLKKNNYDSWLQRFSPPGATTRNRSRPISPDAAWTRLTPAGLAEVWKPEFAAPQHPALAAIDGDARRPGGAPRRPPRHPAPRRAMGRCPLRRRAGAPRPDGLQRPAHPPRRGAGRPQRRAPRRGDPDPVSGGADRRVPGHRRDPIPHLRRHLPGRGQRRRPNRAGAHRRPQAGHLRLPRRRHPHLPGGSRRHRRPAVHPGPQLPLDPRHGAAPPTAASSSPKSRT